MKIGKLSLSLIVVLNLLLSMQALSLPLYGRFSEICIKAGSTFEVKGLGKTDGATAVVTFSAENDEVSYNCVNCQSAGVSCPEDGTCVPSDTIEDPRACSEGEGNLGVGDLGTATVDASVDKEKGIVTTTQEGCIPIVNITTDDGAEGWQPAPCVNANKRAVCHSEWFDILVADIEVYNGTGKLVMTATSTSLWNGEPSSSMPESICLPTHAEDSILTYTEQKEKGGGQGNK